MYQGFLYLERREKRRKWRGLEERKGDGERRENREAKGELGGWETVSLGEKREIGLGKGNIQTKRQRWYRALIRLQLLLK